MSIGRVPGVTGIQPSIVDAKGDLIVATAADSVDRLAVGANNTVLTADSSTATGLKWDIPGGMTLLSTTTLTTGTTSTTVSNISQNYNHLVILVTGIYTVTADQDVSLRVNSDSGTNYQRGLIRSLGTTLAGDNFVNQTLYQFIDRTQTAATAGLLAHGRVTIYNYTSTNARFIESTGRSSSSTNPVTQTNTGVYFGASAISSVTISTGSNLSGGTLFLYGVK